jgi:hypothetical protein
MANAIRDTSVPGWEAEKQKRASAELTKAQAAAGVKALKSALKGKKFSQLNNTEKDALLKSVAIFLGLIEE